MDFIHLMKMMLHYLVVEDDFTIITITISYITYYLFIYFISFQLYIVNQNIIYINPIHVNNLWYIM